jgi:Ca2+-binding RTX toxin-like protein
MNKNRAIVALLAGTLALMLAAGVAWAATVQCQVGAEMCVGTKNPDTITGTSGQDYIRALAGADLARGLGEDDSIVGGRGSDTVKGGNGPDELLWGGEAGPTLDGPFTDASDDYTYGGAGNDHLFGGFAEAGVDRVYGEDGGDYIETYQRGRLAELPGVVVTKEIVNCGAGQDTVAFDKDKDEVAQNCEVRYPVLPGGAGAPPPVEASEETQNAASGQDSPFE